MALNFPANPNDGDTYEDYVFNASKGVWNKSPIGQNIEELLNVEINNPTSADLMTYDADSDKWKNAPIDVEKQITATSFMLMGS